MSAALAAPFLAAAGVLCVSGAAKLRAPQPAVPALALLRLPPRRWLVRLIATAELALGLVALLAPGRAIALAIAVAYAGFAVVAARLVSLRAACGCFGESGGPASPAQSLLSAALAATAGAVAMHAPVRGVAWLADRAPLSAVTLAIGVAGCVYGLVVAYTELPAAWAAWSAR